MISDDNGLIVQNVLFILVIHHLNDAQCKVT